MCVDAPSLPQHTVHASCACTLALHAQSGGSLGELFPTHRIAMYGGHPVRKPGVTTTNVTTT
eukprot:1141073-Pelagomonas_calceolata.AAC.3